MKGMLLVIGLALLVALELNAPARRLFTVEPTETKSANVPEDAGTPDDQSKLFKPEDLLLLEGPDRASWQKPEQIMDELRIAEGSKVADIGAGSGWFTIRLAQRVEQNGVVYAQDVQETMLQAIQRRVSRARFPDRGRLTNVRYVLGRGNSTGLPRGALDAILVVDVYAELQDRIGFLRNLTESLKPQGLIGIVNYKPGTGGPGPPADDRFPPSVVEEDARTANLRVVSTMDLRYEYVVVLGR